MEMLFTRGSHWAATHTYIQPNRHEPTVKVNGDLRGAACYMVLSIILKVHISLMKVRHSVNQTNYLLIVFRKFVSRCS